MRYVISFLFLTAAAAPIFAADIHDEIDAGTGWRVITAEAGATKIRVAPAAGFNVFSIEHAGRQLLKTPKSLADVSGFMYGTPLLYPTPNRVRNARFTFDGKTYTFKSNDETSFIHGLVHDVPWTVRRMEVDAQQALIEAELVFAPGTKYYEKFPLEHTLRVAVTVRDGSVSWQYAVDNAHGQSKVPFGFALHPWFLYQGQRKNTFLTIPATHWMEAENLLPTGKLVDLEGTAFDARIPKSLEGFVIDDVYYGMRSDNPTVAEFRDAGLKVSLDASDEFTHLVVYTPENEDWFCVENQTCSTDAHNLHGQGLRDESHLLIAGPGETLSGSVKFLIDDARGHKFSRWAPAMQKFAAQDRRQPPAPHGILFVGSSSIRFWDLPKSFPGRPVINRGFGGSEMIDSLFFADRIVLPYQPETIVVYAGDNDIAGGASPETVAEDFRRFARKVHTALPETKIVYIAVKPSLKRWKLYGQMAQANELITAIAETDGRIVFADIATPMLNDQGIPKPELFIEDGLHLSPAGYELWTSVIEPLLPQLEVMRPKLRRPLMPDLPVLEKIRAFLNSQEVSYCEVHHQPTFTSEESARARGEDIRVGGKALLLKVGDDFRLFVLPANCKADSAAIRKELGERKTRFATREELLDLTGLVPGCVPPFGQPILPFDLYVDTGIEQNDKIAFNAGSLTDSVILAAADYLRIARPTKVFAFAVE